MLELLVLVAVGVDDYRSLTGSLSLYIYASRERELFAFGSCDSINKQHSTNLESSLALLVPVQSDPSSAAMDIGAAPSAVARPHGGRS